MAFETADDAGGLSIEEVGGNGRGGGGLVTRFDADLPFLDGAGLLEGGSETPFVNVTPFCSISSFGGEG